MHACTQQTLRLEHSHIANVEGIAIYDARLNGSTAYQGTVEVLTYQGWVGVCTSSWGSSDSRVLCRQLGYEYSCEITRVLSFWLMLLILLSRV